MINPPEIPCPGGTIYMVRAGDTLFAIAQRFGLTVETLLAANPDIDPAQNPGADPNRLVVGQPICIPVPAACSGTVYTVMAGDTIFALAARFGTTVQAILLANPGLDPNRLFIGQRICIPIVQPPACPGFVYTIQAGDTVFSLAARYNTTAQAILAANPGIDPNRLFIGQQICIPVPRPPACPGIVHTIQAGDTIFSLAARYGTTAQAILAANPGLDPSRLFIGERICIPVPRPPACQGFTYTIAAGDTLYALARRFNTTPEAILAANPGLDPNRLVIGQQICIPVPAPACTGFLYTVAAGNTLFDLGRRFGTSVEAILAANPGLVPERLAVGQRICIPGPQPTGTAVEPAGQTVETPEV